MVRSTFAGEVLALVAAVDAAIYLSTFLSFILPTPVPVDIYTDCKSVYDHIHSLNPQVTEKRLLIDINIIKEAIEQGHVRHLRWCSTKDMLADAFTKAMVPLELLRFLASGRLPDPE